VDADSALEQLAVVVAAIQQSVKLQRWFAALLKLSEGERSGSIQHMAQEMTTNGEPEQLVAAIWLLANAKVCAAVELALFDEGADS
jgi:hypothetical protein